MDCVFIYRHSNLCASSCPLCLRAETRRNNFRDYHLLSQSPAMATAFCARVMKARNHAEHGDARWIVFLSIVIQIFVRLCVLCVFVLKHVEITSGTITSFPKARQW